MNALVRYPLFVFVASLLLMLVSGRMGRAIGKRHRQIEDGTHQDLDLVVAATLTLLGLIIGFSFSMATNRYDQRKLYEEAEANAIGTEYVRADILPSADAAKVRTLLKEYLQQRILFYEARGAQEIDQINARTMQLQSELWTAARDPATTQPSPLTALVIAGMNDVLNSQGYTQAAWWNRIPVGAWLLMVVVAICANALVGYGMRSKQSDLVPLLVLPLLLGIAFFLIADIDSPRRGVIVVQPQNLISLAQGLN
jgi:hypothetical protein